MLQKTSAVHSQECCIVATGQKAKKSIECYWKEAGEY